MAMSAAEIETLGAAQKRDGSILLFLYGTVPGIILWVNPKLMPSERSQFIE